MRKRRASALSLAFALVATYALVLQMLLGSMLLGSAVAAPVLDEFGNPLCMTHSDGDGRSDRGDTSRPPSCCTQACSVLVPALAPQFSDNFLDNRLTVDGDLVPLRSDAGALERPETLPGIPRAPPLTA